MENLETKGIIKARIIALTPRIEIFPRRNSLIYLLIAVAPKYFNLILFHSSQFQIKDSIVLISLLQRQQSFFPNL